MAHAGEETAGLMRQQGYLHQQLPSSTDAYPIPNGGCDTRQLKTLHWAQWATALAVGLTSSMYGFL